jgi:hypothetical protein
LLPTNKLLSGILKMWRLWLLRFEAPSTEKGMTWAVQLLQLDPKHGMGTLDQARLKLAMGQAKEALKLARTAEGLLTADEAKDQAKLVQQQAEAALAAPK